MNALKILIGVTAPVSACLLTGAPAYFKSRGLEVFVCSAEGLDMRALALRENVAFLPLPMERQVSLFADMRALYRALKLIRAYRPDILVAGTPKAGLLLMVAGWLCAVPVRVLVLRGLRSSSLMRFRRSIMYLMERVSSACAHQVLAISPSLKEEAIARSIVKAGKCTVLLQGSSNGVDLQRFSISAKERETARLAAALGIGSEDTVLGFAGRLVEDKGIKELYEAFTQLRSSYRLKLLLVGAEEEPPLSEWLRASLKADPDVLQTGNVKDIEHYYPLMDMLVLPSYREGWGNVITEAAAMGIPAVATDISGCRDAVQNGATGLLCKVRSAEDLADKIRIYLDDPVMRRRHGQHARKRVELYFANEQIWHAQYALYMDMYNKAKMKRHKEE